MRRQKNHLDGLRTTERLQASREADALAAQLQRRLGPERWAEAEAKWEALSDSEAYLPQQRLAWLLRLEARHSAKLLIVYTSGRFGPERVLGYVIAENAECLRDTTYKVWDIVGQVGDDLARQIADYKASRKAVHITNPKGISNTQDFRKWQRKQKRAIRSK